MVLTLGLEPRLTVPQTAVLPLHHDGDIKKSYSPLQTMFITEFRRRLLQASILSVWCLTPR